MKLIKQTLIFLLLVKLQFTSIEAKTLELLFDHSIQETLTVQTQISCQTQERESPLFTLSSYTPRLIIENIGEQPLLHCLPSSNQSACHTLESLAFKLIDKPSPILALYKLWNQSIIKTEDDRPSDCHPLTLLNFHGGCSQEVSHLQFLKLCNALGIQTRLANIHGKVVYDFGLDEEWSFLDLNHEQIYLGLDNKRLVSSEEIMDDPFLALRTKHIRSAKQIDFVESWKQLAHFEILEPVSAPEIKFEVQEDAEKADGFDLYPHETLCYEVPRKNSDLLHHQRSIEHTVQLEERKISSNWTYVSPTPLRKLINNSSAKVILPEYEVELQPRESFHLKDEEVFKIDVAFATDPKGQLIFSSVCSWTLFPYLSSGENQIHLGIKENPTLLQFKYETNESLENKTLIVPRILNSNHSFSYQSPRFQLESLSNEPEKIWWQISKDPQFELIPSNLDQIDSFTSLITLPLISETFLNPDETYYFRVKAYSKGQWSDWSAPFHFTVDKPMMIEEVEFEQIEEGRYELNWERWAEESDELIEYLIFGSNSLDFIPSIYCEKQVNAIVDDVVTDEENNDNFVIMTTETKIHVNGNLAYYRIIAKKNGQLSVPSSIIHVYDQHLIQPRNVLQLTEDDHVMTAKRTLFPASYPWVETSLPHVSAPQSSVPTLIMPVVPVFPGSKYQKHLLNLQSLLRSATNLEKEKEKIPYELPNVSDEIWEEVAPYLLPPNHPAWPKLNRIFCQSRATLNPDTFKKAGFIRWRPGRWSRVSASPHPELKEYFIKAYCDCELGILYDWKKWIHRIRGANSIRKCIKQYNLQDNFKVPHKWIYPLPKHPSPPNSSHFLRKNFILIAENMRILDHKINEKYYKKKLTRELMDGVYTILQVCGLYDSVYVFNIPFCKDGRIAVIDTEYHHKWPVPFHKLTTKFSKDLQTHWQKITFNGGNIPNGVNQPNPPRMDRRDNK